ncbi:MAG TPA: MalY/PatB family protein [Alkalispirochaeta sp.]|nr:MalY/PatB family protein [Alkalispirochaeta sp.]
MKNFDTVVSRIGTNSIKWDYCEANGATDVLPMWVADMDFPAPPRVIDAINTCAEHGIFGYSGIPQNVWEAVSQWTADRYRWATDVSWYSYTSGVITGLNIAVQTFTRPGEGIIIQPPVYPPFRSAVLSNGRRLIYNPLSCDNEGRYSIDIDHLASIIDDDTKMLVLCNPHNPVGRAWSKEELEAVADIAITHDVLVFSDEIHADLLLSSEESNTHTPFASLNTEVADRTITGIAPSKTFNIAGLKASAIITPNSRLKRDFDQAQERTFGLYNANSFAIAAMQAAYSYGAAWVDELLGYLRDNRDFAVHTINEHLPGVHVATPDATFLLWLNTEKTGMSHAQMAHELTQRARVMLNDGRSFGPGGEHHFRLNFGCPRSVLEEGLTRIISACVHA